MRLWRNRTGAIVGVDGGMRRVAAHLYLAKSNSVRGLLYSVYVERLSPQVVRCSCLDFVCTGWICRHGERALRFEQYIKQKYPRIYAQEKHRQRVHFTTGRVRRPYAGSYDDEATWMSLE